MNVKEGIKPGPKPKGKVKIKWSANFAYAIGLLASDGCVSSNGLHVSFVSKDLDQIKNFLKALKTTIHIGKTKNGARNSEAYRVQFGDVLFIAFLNSIGITKAKSKTIGELQIPEKYFPDFLRGHFDGDGYSYSYFDKRWKSSFMFYIGFVSASKKFISWLQKKIEEYLGIKGHLTNDKKYNSCIQLKYAKKEGNKIQEFMYYKKNVLCLSRKRLKIEQSLYTMAHTRDGRFKRNKDN